MMPTVLVKNEGAKPFGGEFRFNEAEHYYTLDGKPLLGTTAVLGILDKPLTYWASGCAVGELGWLNPKKHELTECLESAQKGLDLVKTMDAMGYMSLLNKAYKAHAAASKEAKGKGTDLHALVEDYIRDHIAGNDPFLGIDPLIKPFAEWADKNVKRFLFTELCCYSRILWVGGKVDFAYEDMEGKKVLADLKSSEKAYFNHYLQIGAYHLQIAENGGFTRDGKKVFEPAEFDYHAVFCARGGLDKPFFNRDTTRVRRAFANCVQLYTEKMFWSKDNED